MYQNPVNLFVLLSFFLLNPMYALAICAILNFMELKINYRIFAIMFALSFAFYFTLRDWSGLHFRSDAMLSFQVFQMADMSSLTAIFNQFALDMKGNEPLWYIYLWLSRTLLGDHVGMFIFTNYLLIFLLTAYLGKIVGGKRFVIVIFCIICVNGGFLSNIYEVWRHTFSLLLFLIGIFLFETNKHRILSRVVMYSSGFVHLVALPLVLLYEFFTFCGKKNARLRRNDRSQMIKWYSFEVIVYVIFVALIITLVDEYYEYTVLLIGITSIFDYTKNIDAAQSGYYFLFNPLSYVVIFYFWFNRKQISKNDIFIGINYFAFILTMLFLDLPTTPIGRALYIFLVGASILSSQLIMKLDLRLGFICILTIIGHHFFNILGTSEGAHSLVNLLNGEYLNPFYGLAILTFKYDTLLVLPQGIL